MKPELVSRRVALTGLVGAGGMILSGCEQAAQIPGFQGMLESAEHLSKSGQRLVLATGQPLAREYQPSDITRNFKANGTVRPQTAIYQQLMANEFSDWSLKVDGLVQQPLELSLQEIKSMPSRTQITRHDCVEGWSAIGEWTGTPLSNILMQAELMPNARYIVFHCADDLENSPDGRGLYYESIDLIDAFHPQTIMAYAMNGQNLPVPHGAPLRVRVERQLGYKMAKYVMRIEAVESFSGLGLGRGGFWEDRGYEWYAGI